MTKAPQVPLEAIIQRHQHRVSEVDISKHALAVLKRLHTAKHSAFVVGGSIRDLLLGHTPKDYDIATDARPAQIRKLFKNSRLVGRRFPLAHIFFGRNELIEVATYRANDDNQTNTNILAKDNIYGDLQSDAWRRDFTANALYYDIADSSIIDLTGGMQDIQQRILRLIGDPDKRYREDPVRMLRAIRFAAKLNFKLDSATANAIPTHAHLLSHVPSARLFEEVVKLYHSGHALQIHQALADQQLLGQLFPCVVKAQCLADNTCMALFLNLTLSNTDQRIKEEKPVTPAFLLAALLWYPLLNQAQHYEQQGLAPLLALEKAMNITLQHSHQVHIPRRYSQVVREIWLLQYRFLKRQGNRAFDTLTHPRFRAAYDFLLLRAQAQEADMTLANWWTDFQQADEANRLTMVENLVNNPVKKRRKKVKKKEA